MSEGLGAFEEHVSYRPGQQIGTMRTLMKWHAKGAKFYIGADTQPRLLDWCTLGDIASCLGAGEIRLAERVTVKKRVPEPAAEPESRPIPTCETCPARVESCTAPGVFQCRLHPAPSSPLRDKHFCFQHPALAGLMQPVANPAPDECDEPERFLFSGKGRPVVTAPPIVIQPDSPFHPPFEVTCKENGTC